MIWNSAYIKAQALAAPNKIKEKVIRLYPTDPVYEKKDYVAIVGGGPKGFYALEQLLTLWKNNPPQQETCIHWFNSNCYFACGPNYRTDLPDYLLINYSIGNINCWPQGQHAFVKNALPLADWIRQNLQGVAEVNPLDFASRELVGYYYMDALCELLQTNIPNVEIKLVDSKITDLTLHEYFSLSINEGLKLPYPYASVLMTTGHCYSQSNAALSEIAEQEKDFTYIANAYPIQQVDRLPAGADVAVMGIGLTFVDVALQLTEGRGGIFHRTEEGDLVYQASGNEVQIFPFSRSNLPMIPRIGFINAAENYSPFILTESWFSRQLAKKEQLNFKQDILPYIEQEVRCAYYAKVYKEAQLSREELVATVAKLKNSDFSFNTLIEPLQTHNKSQSVSYKNDIMNLLNNMFKHIKCNNEDDPYLHSLQAVRYIWSQLPKLYNFNKLDPASHAEFDSFWTSTFSRICFGPPLVNLEKIHCLMKQGIIQFNFSESPKIRYQRDQVELATTDCTKQFQHFIDARIPRGNLAKQNSVLYANLLQRGLIQELRNGDYASGAAAINAQGKSISCPNALLYFYGTPTEGSVLDNDTLSRSKYNYGQYWAVATTKKLSIKQQTHENQS